MSPAQIRDLTAQLTAQLVPALTKTLTAVIDTKLALHTAPVVEAKPPQTAKKATRKRAQKSSK